MTSLGLFNDIILPAGHTMFLGSTQLLIAMSTRYISRGVKAAGA
jgi:hypothetical protein